MVQLCIHIFIISSVIISIATTIIMVIIFPRPEHKYIYIYNQMCVYIYIYIYMYVCVHTYTYIHMIYAKPKTSGVAQQDGHSPSELAALEGHQEPPRCSSSLLLLSLVSFMIRLLIPVFKDTMIIIVFVGITNAIVSLMLLILILIWRATRSLQDEHRYYYQFYN